MDYSLLEQNRKGPSKRRTLQFLLRREFLFQIEGRQYYPRSVYPGINWFILTTLVILLFGFNASRSFPENPSNAIDCLTALTYTQLCLIALRSMVYSALSFSRDLQNRTITVVRISPLSSTLSLMAKLSACLIPLWLEQLLLLPVSLLFFCGYFGLSYINVALALPLTLSVSLLAGCVGLVVGSLTAIPEQAIRNARVSYVLVVFLIPLLKAIASDWFIPLSSLWLWLFMTARRAPHRRLAMTVLTLLAGVTWLIGSSQPIASYLPARLHPLALLENFYQIQPSSSLISSAAVAVIVYLILSCAFFLTARLRYSHAR